MEVSGGNWAGGNAERRQEEGGWSTGEVGGKERQQRVSKDSREAREAKGGCAVVLKG